ncbi:MAG: hypothetical protein WKF34_09685 [Pyrinomonadaceae bacterium]
MDGDTQIIKASVDGDSPKHRTRTICVARSAFTLSPAIAGYANSLFVSTIARFCGLEPYSIPFHGFHPWLYACARYTGSTV